MSKELNDLKKLLKKVISKLDEHKEQLNSLEQSQVRNFTRTDEMYELVTNLSVKMDLFDQQEGQDGSSLTKPKKKSIAKPKKKIIKKKRDPTKAEYFNLMYAQDEDFFNNYITEEIKEEIKEKHAEKWSKLKGDKLYKSQRKAYYTYMTNKHDNQLQDMKKAYIAENKRHDVELVGKDTEE